MRTLTRTIAVYVLLAGLGALQIAYYYPKLPGNVASHFGSAGIADDWMSKQGFLGFEIAVLSFLTVLFVGIGSLFWFAPSLACRSSQPPSGEAKESAADEPKASGDLVARSLACFFFRFGALTVAFILGVFQLACIANLRPDPVLHHTTPLLAGYLLAGGVLVIHLVIRHRQLTKHLPPAEIPAGVWFPAKRYGWGWGAPICWQGWLALTIWLVALAGGIFVISRIEWPAPPAGMAVVLVFVHVMGVALIILCWLKGEKPRWRWGD